MDAQILRCAQDDMLDTARDGSLEIFSPNVYKGSLLLDRSPFLSKSRS